MEDTGRVDDEGKTVLERVGSVGGILWKYALADVEHVGGEGDGHV